MDKCIVTVIRFIRNKGDELEKGINVFFEDERSIIIDMNGHVVPKVYRIWYRNSEGTFVINTVEI